MDGFALKTFRGRTMQEALALVRQEFGSEAVVLQTRQLSRSGWIGPRNMGVEITAAPGHAWPSNRMPAKREVQPNGRPPMTASLDEVMVGDGSPRGVAASESDWRAKYRRKWLEGELSEKLVGYCIDAVAARYPEGAPGEMQIRDAAVAALAGLIQVGPSWDDLAGRRILFVGGSGAGKTTTIAKLAAIAKTRYRLRVVLVTLDTYRVGASEQLSRFAEILDLPLEIVHSAEGWRERWRALQGHDLVLIDSSARSVASDAVMKTVLEGSGPALERLLVLAANQRDSSLRLEMERFAPFRCSGLVIGKWDEVQGRGMIADMAIASRLPVHFVSTGPRVPDDLEPANGTRLAAWALGENVEPLAMA